MSPTYQRTVVSSVVALAILGFTPPVFAQLSPEETSSIHPTQTTNLPQPGTTKLDAVTAAKKDAALCRPQSFKVYYSADADDFSHHGYAVIDQALINIRANPRCRVGQIQIHGFADTHGSILSNTETSKFFSEKVRNYMLDNDVSSFMVTTRAYGETYLAKATQDDVKEPLNRRIEVLIDAVEAN